MAGDLLAAVLRDRSALDEQLVCVLDVADCRYDRSGQLAAELTAERVGVDLLLDLLAQPAADGTRLVLFVNAYVFTDARNLCFDLRKEAGFCTSQTKNYCLGYTRGA